MEAAKLNVDREPVGWGPLAGSYEIIGELRGGKLYFARRRETRDEVIVRVVRSSETGGNNALAHLASDVQLLRTLSHPHMPRVLDGRWLGAEAFAVVSERIYGTTMEEIIDRNERLTNPRIASLLEDVYAVIAWARANSVVHRGVTPESIILERDTNRLFVSLGPTPIPITGVPGEAADARTIGRLAWTLLSGTRPDETDGSSLAQLCPNLATRIVDETEKLVRLRDDAEPPDVGHFIGIVGAGDVLKQAEVELTASKDEYIEWRENEIQKYESHRIELERQVAERIAVLDRERHEFARFARDERATIETERLQMEAAIAERQQRLAEVRAELDRQRATLERRLANLESQRSELVRLRDEAIALGASVRIRSKPNSQTPVSAAWWDLDAPVADHADSDAAPAVAGTRANVMQWLGPIVTVVVLMLLIALGVNVSRQSHRRAAALSVGGMRIVPTAPALDSGRPPRGGFLTQSSGGQVTKRARKNGAPVADSAARRDSVRSDSAARRDSVRPDTIPRDTTRRPPPG
ncbi:MAG TPA: protein kinase [Gemmatimonadaceae bacterium]|nr:protein kinase [Gemmatimonadaceae bacterium]